MNKLYKRPITATVFECLGGAAFIAGVFAFIAALVDSSNAQSGVPAAIAGAVCVIMAAVYIGIGQVIAFLGRATYRSEQIGSILVEEVLPQLKGMDTRVGDPSHVASTPSDTDF